jgi:hypothetical protein
MPAGILPAGSASVAFASLANFLLDIHQLLYFSFVAMQAA